MSFSISFNETLSTLPKNQLWLQAGIENETQWIWDGVKWAKVLVNKEDIDSAEAAAKQDAKDYASTLLQSLADGTFSGTFIDGKSLISPTVVGLQGTFAELMAGNPFGARLELGESAGEPFLEAYDDGGDLRVKLLQDSLEFSANGVKGGKLEAEYFGAGGVEGQAGLLLSSTYSIKLQALYYAWMETYGAGVQCAGETVAMWGDSGVHALSPLCLREPNGSAANKQIDFWDGYSLYRDDAGAGGNNTRIWLDTPHAGEVVVGPRGSASWLGQLRIRALDTRIETYTGRSIRIWGIDDPYIEPNGDGYGYVGSASKRFNAMWAGSFNQTSEERLKTNIAPADRVSCYDQVKALRFKTYNLINEMEEAEAGIKAEAEAKAGGMEGVNGAEGVAGSTEAPTTYIGIIADEAPDIVCDAEKKNINLYSYASLVAAAVQELQERLEALEGKLISG